MSAWTENWLALAEYDIITAQAMFDTGRYAYVAFCSQQAIEKVIKALIAERTHTTPPYIHNLVRLVDLAGIQVDADIRDWLDDLTQIYIHSRYPDEMKKVAEATTRQSSEALLSKTKEIYEWLKSQLM